jgi:anti-sigma factor RsiW
MADRQPTEFELHAYVDGQLDPARRFAIESQLTHDPERAAWVMGELSTRTALGLLAEDARPAAPAAVEQMARLGEKPAKRLMRPVAIFGGVSLAAAASLVLAWPAGPPGYVDYAVSSHRIAMMRASMPSQIEAPTLNAKEIESSTSIDLPVLPADWRVTDVQLFPTDEGPALLVAVTAGDGQRMSLFALKSRSDAPKRPSAVREGLQSVAYWRRDDMSYALTGDAEPGAIDARAERLVRS